MNPEIKNRIEQIKNGAIPDGYISTKAGVFPKWDCAHINQIAEPITEKVGDGTYETLSISAGIGFVNQAKKFGKELSGKQYEKYTVLKRGDFSYNKGNSKTYPQGCIYRLKDREVAAVPNVFESFVVRKGNPDYYEQLFIGGFLNKQLSTKINHGVRDDGLLNLTGKDFYSCYLPVPPLEEQQKIAEILMQCDKVIELKKKRIDEEKKLKKALMQKFFDNKSINAKEVKLHSVCDFNLLNIAENTDAETMFYYIDISCVENGNIIQPTNKIAFKDAPVRARKKFCKNDILMSTVRPNLHSFVLVDFDANEYVCSTGFAVLTPKKYYHTEIIYQQLFSEKLDRQYNNLLVGTNYPALNTSDIKSLKVVIPTDDNECRMISEVLSKQDGEISSLNKELEFYLIKKKALMQLILTGIVRVK